MSGIVGKGVILNGDINNTLSSIMPISLAQNLVNKFSYNEWALIGTNGLIGENGIIGTNGVMSVRNYGGISESILWKLIKKKPNVNHINNEHNIAMNSILYRIENILKYGIILQNGGYYVSFGKNVANIPFNVNDTSLHTVNIYMPFFNGNPNNLNANGISWTTQIYADTFQNIFLTLITEFNVFCDKSVQLQIVDDVTTPPIIPPPTIVQDTIANFKSVVDSSTFTYSF